MDEKKLIKTDFIVSILIILFSVFIIIKSFMMPKYEEWGLYATPSITPIVFSALLLFTGLILFVRSIVRKGYKIRITREHFKSVYSSKAAQRFLLVLGLVIVYSLLLGKVHFVVLSTAYMFFNMCYFKSTVWWKNLIISGVIAFAVWLLFDVIFLIPLP
ncbi:MAG: tripartite tricarboxylate transporter TctB family protein [bacterium]|nr:tripartite tricarboxylate transporter TctB family protein [bacterium]